MNKRNVKIIASILGALVIISGILLLFLTRGSGIKIGYVSKGYDNTLKASFKYFDGRESKKVKFDVGDNVTINYTIEEEKGDIQLVVENQEGEEVISKNNGSGEETFNVSKTQKYTINIIATKAKGKFNVEWNKR